MLCCRYKNLHIPNEDSIVCLPFGGTWKQVGTDIDGTAEGDEFGSSVAMSKDGYTIVVGAPYNSNMNGIFAGHVRVYSINSENGNWQQLGADLNGKAENNFFGWSVCISDDGKAIAIGANGNDNVNGVSSGQVLVYYYISISNMWVQVGSDINGKRELDNLGWSVDMSADGKTIAIGVLTSNNANGERSGVVRVYSINTLSGNWTQLGADIDGEAENDNFGFDVAMSSDSRSIVIGAPNNDNVMGTNAGNVQVFTSNSTATNRTQRGTDIFGKASSVNSGYSVAIASDGKTIAIGAPLFNNINSNVGGSVRVYTINGTSGNWTQVGLEINGAALDDQSGYSVAMSADGKTIAIGAPLNDNLNGDDSGHVRVFSINSTSGNWTQVGLDITGEASGDQSGASVAISNDGFTLAIGAPLNVNSNNSNAGHVRVYKYELPATKAPTRMPTKSPTKHPTKRPTKAPSKTPTKFPTKRPTKNPTSTPSKSPTKQPTKVPSKLPTKVSTKGPTKNPTNAPSQIKLPLPISVPIQVSVPTPIVSVPSNCGLFNLNFFCPRRGECGFWRRLLNLRGC